jgi:hypothetical protein
MFFLPKEEIYNIFRGLLVSGRSCLHPVSRAHAARMVHAGTVHAPSASHAHARLTVSAHLAAPQWLPQAAVSSGSYCNMCNTRSTFIISR